VYAVSLRRKYPEDDTIRHLMIYNLHERSPLRSAQKKMRYAPISQPL
jgi:hypothetical protein